jgi:ATP-binding cassette subfamily C protein
MVIGMFSTLRPVDLIHSARSLLLRGALFSAFISVFLNLVTFVGPIFMIQVYERVIPARSHETLYGLVIIGFGGVVLFGLLDFIRSYICQIIAHGLARKLNLPALQAGVLRSIEGGVNEGGQAIRDISDLRAFLSGNAVTTPLDALCALFFIGGLYFIHAIYGHVALGFILFMVTLNVLTDRLTRGAIRQANDASNRHAADVAGSLRHAEVIEAMGMMPALVRSWRSTQLEMLTMSATAGIRAKAVLAISKATQKSLQMVTVTTGAILVLAHEINPGVLFAGMVLTSQAVAPFSHMIESWRSYVSAAQAWGRISALVRQQSALRQTMPALTGNGSLVVENLVYVPPGRDLPVLRGLSFTVHPGEILGIAGPSGAGKSTLARALVGIIRPDVGGVYLDGHSTFLWERGSFGRAVGYLPQSLSLLDGTVRQTIARMEASDPREVIRAAQAADIHDFIGRLPHGYDTPVAEGTHLLSGGQLQRLALARALYGSPKLLILDEPNSNLDQVGEQALIRAIGAARARGAIVIIIAHRPSVMSTADKILILENGSISQYGPRNDVIDLAAGNGKQSAKGATIAILPSAGDGR